MEQRLGTAQWADPEIVETNYPYRDGTVWIGRTASNSDASVGYDDDRHVCLVCGTRGGKGTSSIINNLCLWPGPLVVIDPKGENATVTAARRGQGSKYCEGMGQKVYVLDPFEVADVDPSYRARFNPLDAIRADDTKALDKAAAMADAIVVSEGEKNNYWEETARQMIKALILHVATEKVYEGRRNLTTVRRLLSRGDWETVERLQAMGEEDIPSAHQLLWTAVAKNPAFGGRMADMGDELCAVMKDAPETYGGGFSQAKRNVEFLESFGLEDNVSQSDFQLSDLKTDPKGVSIYLCLPQMYMNTHYRWLRLFVGLLVAEMENVQTQPACGHRILVLLDEFAGLERMKSIEKAAAFMAGYGLKMFFVLQSLVQLQAVYKDVWENFLTNCSLKLFFSIDDNFTRDYITKQLGDVEVIREVRSAGANSSETQSESDSRSLSRSRTQSESMAQSMSLGHSQSKSTNWAMGNSVTRGENMSSSSSATTTNSGQWPAPFWGPNPRTSSYSSTTGSSWGTSVSETSSHSRGGSEGTSETTTEGVSRTVGDSTGETEGATRGVTRGRTSGRTSGTAETVHKRPLCTMDEIGKLFSRIDDRRHFAFPGLGLALMSGKAPVIFRRVNYFEDLRFIGLFGPHPDHELLPATRSSVDPDGLRAFDHHFQKALSWARAAKAGAIVRAGDVVAYARTDTGRKIPIRAPREGRIVVESPHNLLSIPAQTTPQKASAPLLTQVRSRKIEILHYLNGASAVDPFADLEAYCEELEAERARRAREEAEARAAAAKRRRIEEQQIRNGRRWKIRDRRSWWWKAAGIVSAAGLVDGGVFALNHSPVEILVGFGVAGGLALCGRKIRQTFIEEREVENPPQKPKARLPVASAGPVKSAAPPALAAGGKAEATEMKAAKGMQTLPGSPMVGGEGFLAHLESTKTGKPPEGVSPEVWKIATQALKNFNAGRSPENKDVTPAGSMSPDLSADIDARIAEHNRQIEQAGKDGKKMSIDEMIDAHNRKYAPPSNGDDT